jgi:hypothetical protein
MQASRTSPSAELVASGGVALLASAWAGMKAMPPLKRNKTAVARKSFAIAFCLCCLMSFF